MSRNLRRFNTEADYNAATLNYPAVSWVTGTDAVHFDKAAPADLSKVMMAFTTDSSEMWRTRDITLWNGGASLPVDELFTDLTLNDVNVIPLLSDVTGVLYNYAEPSTDYVAKYGLLDDTLIDSTFSGSLGINALPVEFFIPSSVSSIEALPGNANKVVIDNETVPTISLEWSSMNSIDLYVPDSALSAYQTAIGSILPGTILPMSQYSGNLPI